MSSNIVRKFVKEYKPIEIKEPFKTDVIEFANTNDFTEYYREHEDDFNNISTYKLNVKYKIPGYKISKRRVHAPTATNTEEDKKEIILVKDYRYTPMVATLPSAPSNNYVTIEMFNELEKRISNIENYLTV